MLEDAEQTEDEEPQQKRKGKGKSARSAKGTIGDNCSTLGKRQVTKREWPPGREAQAKAVLAALRDEPASVTPDELAARFSRAKRETIEELLAALATLGQARRLRGGKYTV